MRRVWNCAGWVSAGHDEAVDMPPVYEGVPLQAIELPTGRAYGGVVKFDNRKVDVSGVQDRRGIGGRAAIGGGGVGIVGLIIYVLVAVVGGGDVDATKLVPPGNQVQETGSTDDLKARCNSGPDAIDKYDDCYLVKVYNEINEVWTAEFSRRGDTYREPTLAFFTDAVDTGCGQASSQVGPFYCPPDERIYIDIGFLDQLQQQFGAQGRYAQAYVLAHEAGHHLQTLLGTERIQPVGASFPRPGRVTVRFGAPLHFTAPAGSAGKARREATDRIMAEIQRLSGQQAAGCYNELSAGP